VGVSAAIYFLQILITGQAAHLAALLSTQQRQQTELVLLHKQEFDALLEMANRLSAVSPPPSTSSPIAPGSPILQQPPRR
jgi:hypothetical protein